MNSITILFLCLLNYEAKIITTTILNRQNFSHLNKRNFLNYDTNFTSGYEGDQSDVKIVKFQDKFFSIWIDSEYDQSNPAIVGKFFNFNNSLIFYPEFQVNTKFGNTPMNPDVIVIDNKLIVCYTDYYVINYYSVMCKHINNQTYTSNYMFMNIDSIYNPLNNILEIKNFYFNNTIYKSCLGIQWKNSGNNQYTLNIYDSNLKHLKSIILGRYSTDYNLQSIYFNDNLYINCNNGTLIKINFNTSSSQYLTIKFNNTIDNVYMYYYNETIIITYTQLMNEINNYNMSNITEGINISNINNTIVSNSSNINIFYVQQYDTNWNMISNLSYINQTNLKIIFTDDFMIFYEIYNSQLKSKIIQLNKQNNLEQQMNNSIILTDSIITTDINNIYPLVLFLDKIHIIYIWESMNYTTINSDKDLVYRIYEIIIPNIVNNVSNLTNISFSNVSINTSSNTISSSNTNTISSSNTNNISSSNTISVDFILSSNTIITNINSSNNIVVASLHITNFDYNQLYYFNSGTFTINGGNGTYNELQGGTINIQFNDNYYDQTINIFTFSSNIHAYDNLVIDGLDTCYLYNDQYYQIQTQSVEYAEGVNVYQAIFSTITCTTNGSQGGHSIF